MVYWDHARALDHRDNGGPDELLEDNVKEVDSDSMEEFGIGTMAEMPSVRYDDDLRIRQALEMIDGVGADRSVQCASKDKTRGADVRCDVLRNLVGV